MLKNRILILFIVILCVFGFGCGSVYATEEAVNTEKFSFTGFDGVLYTLPSLPEGVNNYKHYVILKDNSFSWWMVDRACNRQVILRDSFNTQCNRLVGDRV